MTDSAPWAVRTEVFASRLGSGVSIVATSVPVGVGIDVAEFSSWHLALMVRREPALEVTDLEAFDATEPTRLVRFGSLPGDEPRHLVEVISSARGMLRAVVAEGPMSHDVRTLIAEAMEWIRHESTLHLTIEEFATLERVLGVSPAAFVARSRLIDEDAGAPGGVVDAVARSLALREILQRDAAGAWSLTSDRGAIVAPLLGSRSAVWVSGQRHGGDAFSAGFGRTDGWSLVVPDEGGGIVVTAIEQSALGVICARLAGLSVEAPATQGRALAMSRTALSGVRSGSALEGVGTITATAQARFVRPADAGMEELQVSWLTAADGGQWLASDEGGGEVVVTPDSGEAILSRLVEGFDGGSER